MSHAQAESIVERLRLVGPCHGTIHGDFDRVKAALDEHPETVEALNALDPGQMEETPQGAAAHLGCREILEYMLAKGVRLDIFMACALGMTEQVARLLATEPKLANACGAHGIHVLNHAADVPTARLLLESGADPNQRIYAPWGWTPVHAAAAAGRMSILELLVRHGGDPGLRETGTSPLHAAARNGHCRIVAWLLASGVPAHVRGSGGPWEGKTPLCIAQECGHAQVAKVLHRHTVAPRLRDVGAVTEPSRGDALSCP
jgi:ankyrin repeat protein